MSDEQLLKKYEEMDYILHLSDGFLWQDILRNLGGGVVFLLSWLNDFIENIIDKIITFNNFYSSGPIKEFMDVARPVVWGVFLIALFVLGFQFMLNKVEKRNEVVLNIILALCFIVVLPDLMSNLGKITNASVKKLNPETESLAGELVKSNVADVLYYANKGFNYSGKKDGDSSLPPRPQSKGNSRVGTTDFTYANQLPKNHTWAYIPYTQKLDVHENEPKALEKLNENAINVLSNQAIPTGNGKSQTVSELQKNVMMGTGSLGRESYYRYHVNWMVLIFSLIVTTVALVITVIKIGRSIFDLAFHQVYGMFIAATDLTGGQRTKKVLTEIISTFAVIFIMTMLLKFFMMYSVWANGLKSSIGAIGVLLLLIAGAWALIDAPDIVQRTLGIDAGLRSGWQAMMGAYAATRAGGAIGSMIGKGASAVTKGATGGVNFMRRTGEGMFTKTPSENEKSGANKTSVKEMPGTSSSANQDTSKQTQNHTSNETQRQTNPVGSMENMGEQTQPDSEQQVSSVMNNQKEQQPSQKMHPETSKKKPDPIPSQKQAQQQGNHQETKQNLRKQDKSIPRQNSADASQTVPPSGYDKTDSGILIPESQIPKTTSIPISSNEPSAEPISETTSNESASTSSSPSPSKGNYGHKEATYSNTWIGGNRRVQNLKENWVRAGNSGFDLGQNIRRVGQTVSKPVVKPIKKGIDKIKRENVSDAKREIERKGKNE